MNIYREDIDDCVAEAFSLGLDRDRELTNWKAMFSDPPRLAAVRFACPRQDPPRSVDEMLLALASRAREIVQAYATAPVTVWLFFGDGLGQEPSRIVRHKKLWKGVAAHFKLTDLEHGPEVEIESDDGRLHYAIVAKVKPASFEQAILLVHKRQAFMLISRQELDSEQQTLDLYNTAFAPGHGTFPKGIHWRDVIYQRCFLSGDVLIKTGSDSYRNEFSVELIGPHGDLTLHQHKLLKNNGFTILLPAQCAVPVEEWIENSLGASPLKPHVWESSEAVIKVRILPESFTRNVELDIQPKTLEASFYEFVTLCFVLCLQELSDDFEVMSHISALTIGRCGAEGLVFQTKRGSLRYPFWCALQQYGALSIDDQNVATIVISRDE